MKNLLIILILCTILVSCEDSQSVYDPNKGFEIIDFSPKVAAISDTVTLFIKNLSPDIDLIYVNIGNVYIPNLFGLQTKNNISQIKFIVPAKTSTDNIRVTVSFNNKTYEVKTKEELVIETYPMPTVGVLYPPSGCPGTIITIPGKGFLPYKKNMKVILGVLEYNLINITDDKAQFILPEINAQFDVFLKFNDGIILPVTSDNHESVYKLLVGRDTSFTFWPAYSSENEIITLKIFYPGINRPRVFFGNIESEVVDYKPVRYEYHFSIENGSLYRKLNYYDGYIRCKAPKVNSPCKIRVVTDCGESQSTLEYNNINFRTVSAEVNNLTVKMKSLVLFDTIPTYYNKNLSAIFAIANFNHLKKAENNYFHFFIDNVVSNDFDYSGKRYSFKFDIGQKYVILGFDDVGGSSGHMTSFQYYSSYEITVRNLRYSETDTQIIYYLNGDELKHNISVWWRKERTRNSIREYFDELVELINFTDSTTVKLILNK